MREWFCKVLSAILNCKVSPAPDDGVYFSKGFTLWGNSIKEVHLMDNCTGELIRPWRISELVENIRWQNEECFPMTEEVF